MTRHPPIDPEIDSALRDANAPPASVRPVDIVPLRSLAYVDHAAATRGGTIEAKELVVSNVKRTSPLHAVVLRAAHRRGDTDSRLGPGTVYIHGGGMIFGDPWDITEVFLQAASEGCVIVSPGYRLAPEHGYPSAVDDCFHTWRWTLQHADELGIDPKRLSIAGSSAGGGLAASTTLLARDSGTSLPCHQILHCPMIDDREITPSSVELDGEGCWDRTANRTGWSAYLGNARGGDDVPIYAAPARAIDLRGLPPTYIDVGGVDTFRDEDVDFGARLARAGVPVEMHVWPGAVHGFTRIAPTAAVARAAMGARMAYIRRNVLADWT